MKAFAHCQLSSSCIKEFQDVVLSEHNKLRKKHQVAPLSWDSSVQSVAEAFIPTYMVKHLYSNNKNYGENIGSICAPVKLDLNCTSKFKL